MINKNNVMLHTKDIILDIWHKHFLTHTAIWLVFHCTDSTRACSVVHKHGDLSGKIWMNNAVVGLCVGYK